jgi:DNA-directed RNA polymerase subunit RPC12/RpoP
MGRYVACTNCGNVESGTPYYKCKQCGKFFCRECAKGLRSMTCPHCNYTPVTGWGLGQLGQIG